MSDRKAKELVIEPMSKVGKSEGKNREVKIEGARDGTMEAGQSRKT